MPATIARTANAVVIVEETLTLAKGKSPVRINHKPSRIMPIFLPAKLFVRAMGFSLSQWSVVSGQ